MLIITFDFLMVSGAAAWYGAPSSASSGRMVVVSIGSLLGSGLGCSFLPTLLFLAVDGGSRSIIGIGSV
jgi:hypothetical protein